MIQRIAIIGLGTMGPGMAARLARGGLQVVAYDVAPAAIERGRQAGFHDYVAKFDRPGLIAALKEQTAEVERAA